MSTEVENTPCGDAGGWTALPVWETGARLGKARITSLAISSFRLSRLPSYFLILPFDFCLPKSGLSSHFFLSAFLLTRSDRRDLVASQLPAGWPFHPDIARLELATGRFATVLPL